MSAKFVVGIDLGTTHSALAFAPLEATDARVSVLPIEQLVSASALAKRSLLPSFLYFAHESEAPLALPWDEQRHFAVGEFARARAAEAPQRVIASAKSWLSYGGIDRRAGNLPLGAPEDVEKISPVEASFRFLDHLPGRMIGVRQFDCCVGECAAALVGADLELGTEAEQGQQLLLRFAGMFPLDVRPGQVEVAGQLAQALGDQLVLGFEMTVEGRLVRPGGLGDRVDADPVNPVAVK